MNGKRVDLYTNPMAGVTDIYSLMSGPIVDSGQREIEAARMSYSFMQPDALSDANHRGIANGGKIPLQPPRSTLRRTSNVVNVRHDPKIRQYQSHRQANSDLARMAKIEAEKILAESTAGCAVGRVVTVPKGTNRMDQSKAAEPVPISQSIGHVSFAQGDNSTASTDSVESALTSIMDVFGCSPENGKVKWIVEGQRVHTLNVLLHGKLGKLREQLQAMKKQNDKKTEVFSHLKNSKREFGEMRVNTMKSLRARMKVEPVTVCTGWGKRV